MTSSSRSGTKRLAQGHIRQLWESKFENVLQDIYIHISHFSFFLYDSVKKFFYSHHSLLLQAILLWKNGRIECQIKIAHTSFLLCSTKEASSLNLAFSEEYADMLLPRKLGNLFSPSIMAKNHISLYQLIISTHKNTQSCRTRRETKNSAQSLKITFLNYFQRYKSALRPHPNINIASHAQLWKCYVL